MKRFKNDMSKINLTCEIGELEILFRRYVRKIKVLYLKEIFSVFIF